MTNVLREGMRAAISCQVLEGDLPLTFNWQRNGKDELGSGATVRRLDEYSTSLVIDKIESSHSANYTCIVQNIAGSESFTVPLTVNGIITNYLLNIIIFSISWLLLPVEK